MTIKQLMARFPTEDDCKQFLVDKRWPGGKVRCPRCQSEKIAKLSKRPFHWQCRQCSKNGYRFSPLAGTIFENTNVPLRLWFEVINLMLTSKKGISAMQVRRLLAPVRGETGAYRTAWYMCHRIRAAMKNDEFRKLTGYVEVDETFIGGKAKNRHGGGTGGGRKRGQGGTGGMHKAPVIGAISRKGNVVCKMIENTQAATLNAFVHETVSDKVKLVATDEYVGYKHLRSLGYPHETVSHTKGEYVRGNVHTANLGAFWSLLNRGIVGNFHQVSKKYLPLYINEFAFRHNNRHEDDVFGKVVASC